MTYLLKNWTSKERYSRRKEKKGKKSSWNFVWVNTPITNFNPHNLCSLNFKKRSYWQKNKNKYQGNRIRKRKPKGIIRKNNGDCLLKSDIKSHRQFKFESSKRLNWTAKYCDFKTILNTNEREWLERPGALFKGPR